MTDTDNATGRRSRWSQALGVVYGSCLAAYAWAEPVIESSPANEALKEVGSFGQQFVRMLVMLLAIIVALLVVARLLPRWLGRPMHSGPGRVIEVVESIRLEPRKGLYLIKVAKQYFLVGATDGHVQMVAGGPLDTEAIDAALQQIESAGPQTGASAKTGRAFLARLRRRSCNKDGAMIKARETDGL